MNSWRCSLGRGRSSYSSATAAGQRMCRAGPCSIRRHTASRIRLEARLPHATRAENAIASTAHVARSIAIPLRDEPARRSSIARKLETDLAEPLRIVAPALAHLDEQEQM